MDAVVARDVREQTVSASQRAVQRVAIAEEVSGRHLLSISLPDLRIAALTGAAVAALAIYFATGAWAFELTAPSFRAGGKIPAEFTCSGADQSPELRWQEAPADTRAFALLMTDPDAPSGTFTHWLVFNLPPALNMLPANASRTLAAYAPGAIQGATDFGRSRYGGPCPPPGSPHNYHFRLYALDTPLALDAGASAAQLESAMKGHVLGTSELIGTFGR
jgi:Raf kinase inhibitor-like YbhB/YbcL family protein